MANEWDFTPDEWATIIEETVDNTSKDLDILLTIIQQIAKFTKDRQSRDLDTSLQHPILMLFNQCYTNTLLLEEYNAKFAAIERKLDKLLSLQKTERV